MSKPIDLSFDLYGELDAPVKSEPVDVSKAVPLPVVVISEEEALRRQQEKKKKKSTKLINSRGLVFCCKFIFWLRLVGILVP